MDRAELYMADTYKCEELKKRLKPVTDWEVIRKGNLIWHNDSNSINGFDYFEGLNPTDENIIVYRNKDGKQYNRSRTRWYYYDESIVDEVEKHYTPKLYVIRSAKYQEDNWFTVAFDERHMMECFKKEMREEYLTDEEFQNRYIWEQLKNVDGFEIVLK